MTELPLTQYECPHCGGQFRVDASFSGGRATCPNCQGVVAIAGQMPAAAAQGDRGQDGGADPIWLSCPVCQGVFRAGQELAGGQVICPHCQNRVAVPDSTPAQVWGGDRPKSSGGDASVAAQTPLAPHVPDTRSDTSPLSPPPLPVTTDQFAVTIAAGEETDAERAGTVAEGGVAGIEIHETRRIVKHGDQVIELRHLTPEEKARQRLVKNIVLFVVCVGILVSYVLYHVGFWPFSR